jgi:hypothetical protein
MRWLSNVVQNRTVSSRTGAVLPELPVLRSNLYSHVSAEQIRVICFEHFLDLVGAAVLGHSLEQ